MDEAFNPYSPPQAILKVPVDYEAEDCWRHGRTLFLRAGRALPCRCIRCNAPCVTPILPRKVFWHAAGWYLLVIFWVIFYALVAVAVRRKATIYPGLCVTHTRRRARAITVTCLSIFGGIGLFVLAGMKGMPIAALAGMVLLILALFVGNSSRLLYASRIDDRVIQLKGAGGPFLDSLPSM